MILNATNELRLYGAVLQQKWTNTIAVVGPYKYHEEWRDVPVVEAPKIEAGKWYIDKGLITFFTKIDLENNNCSGYGQDFRGDWWDFTDCAIGELESIFPASNEEVKERLVEEAKKRGYKKGVMCLFGEKGIRESYLISDEFEFNSNDNNLHVKEGYDVIFKDGIWVQILPPEKKYPMSVNEINGRKWYISDAGDINEIRDNSLITKNHFSTESRAKAFVALMQLLELRDEWNKVDGFVVDWETTESIYCIDANREGMLVTTTGGKNHIRFLLSFGFFQTRDEFLEQFRPLIEEAKELL